MSYNIITKSLETALHVQMLYLNERVGTVIITESCSTCTNVVFKLKNEYIKETKY